MGESLGVDDLIVATWVETSVCMHASLRLSGNRTLTLLSLLVAANPDECVSGQRSEQRCHGFDVLCRFGSSQGRCLNDRCICPEVPNRDSCTCLRELYYKTVALYDLCLETSAVITK